MTFVASGSTEGTVSISTGTISAGDIIAAEINNTSSVSVDSTPKVMMFTIANDSTVTEMDHQHGWTTGNISETPDPDWYYYYLFSFAAAYASSTTIRFDNSYVTTIFASATSWGSTIFGLSSQQLYVGRIWKLTPNNATDSISAPTIGSFSTCFYDSFLNVSYINATITNNHDQTAIIQYDTTSFISSSAQEIAIPAGQSQSIQFVFSGNIQFSSRTIAARASVNGNFSTTTTRTESISFCAS